MALALILLAGTYLLVLIVKKAANFSIFDGFFFVMSPFVFIILLNNLFFYKMGFLMIPADIVHLHTVAVIIFGLGTLIVDAQRQTVRVQPILSRYETTDISLSAVYLITCFSLAIVFLDMIMRVRAYGLANVLATAEGTEQGSFAAHLTLLLTPLSVLLFDSYCEKKKKLCLLLLALCMVGVFATFIKYHIISAVLTLAIYTIVRRPALVKKAIIFAGIGIVLFFVLNYAIGFAVRDMEVAGSFYLNHLWKYLVGGTANIDNIPSYLAENKIELSFSEWTLAMGTSFWDMFSLKFFGKEICDYQFSTILPNFPLNVIGDEQSNVISFLGAVYVHTNLAGFIAFMLIWGIVVQCVYAIVKGSRSLAAILPASVFLTYNMLSFFSCFWELSNPMETIFLAFALFFFLPRNNEKKRMRPLKELK